MHKYLKLIWRNEKLQKRDFSNLVLEFEFFNMLWNLRKAKYIALSTMFEKL